MTKRTLISQTELAKRLGCSQPNVHKLIERGKIRPECLHKVGRWIQIDLDCALKSIKDNVSPLRHPKVRRPQPTENQEKALKWAHSLDAPAIMRSLRYIVKLHELAPDDITIDFPGPGQTAILIRYPNVEEEGPAVPEVFALDMIFSDPADFESVAEEEDLPDWYYDQYEEFRARVSRIR